MMNRVFKYTHHLAVKVALLLVLWAAINYALVTLFPSARLDLTENSLYTLSDGTKKILTEIEEPIQLTFFYSRSLGELSPRTGTYAKRVENLLYEYVRLADGKLTFEVVDPEPFSEAEDLALSKGMQGIALDQSGNQYYFGLAGESTLNALGIVPFFQAQKEAQLEYDVSKLIYSLIYSKRPKVALFSKLPLDGDVMQALKAGEGIPDPWVIAAELRGQFEMQAILNPATELLDQEFKVLILLHPYDLTPTDLYAIDQYVLRGGRVVALVDPLSEVLARKTLLPGVADDDYKPPRVVSDFDFLLQHWGVQMLAGNVVADRELAQRINTGQDGPLQIVDYVAWLGLEPEQMNQEDVTVTGLPLVNMATAGALSKVEGATTTFTPLLQTTNDAMLVPAHEVARYPDYQGLLKNFVPTSDVYTLAARLTGELKTAFPSGPPKSKKIDDIEKTEHFNAQEQLKESVRPANIIVVADTDFLQDSFWVQTQNFFNRTVAYPFAGNGDFVLNIVEQLAGSDALLSLRSRGLSRRPFVLVEDLQRQAEAIYLDRQAKLEDKLKTIEQNMVKLRSAGGENQQKILTPEEQKMLHDYQQEIVQTRRDLRHVQAALRGDIETLENWLLFFNIGFMPLAIIVLLGGFVILRRRRRQ